MKDTYYDRYFVAKSRCCLEQQVWLQDQQKGTVAFSEPKEIVHTKDECFKIISKPHPIKSESRVNSIHQKLTPCINFQMEY